jgi:hypothetical protein
LTRLINPESQVELQNHLTLEDMGMPSEHALAAGVIQLYAQKLKKVVVADKLQIAPGEVTDSKLAVLCDSIRDDPPDILVMCGCCHVTNISCLLQLSTISHLDISSCNLGPKGGLHLAGVIKDMRALTSLDISINGIASIESIKKSEVPSWSIGDEVEHGGQKGEAVYWSGNPSDYIGFSNISGIAAITNAIRDMGVMSNLHVGQNHIPEKEMRNIMAIAMRMDSMKILCEVPIKNKTLTELDISGNNLCKEGALVVAGYLDGNGALSVLSLKKNSLGTKEAGKALGEMLKVNSVLKELDLSNNYVNPYSGGDGPGFAQELALGIKDNGAISQFTFSGDGHGNTPVTMEISMTEADFSAKGLGESGAIMVAAFLPKCT